MRIIEIKTLENGAHRNQSGFFRTIPDGWAVIPDTISAENFPFGDVTAEKIDGVMTVTSWTAREIPVEPEHTFSPADLREQAYNNERIIEWRDKPLTVSEAAVLWQFYAAEGSEKASELGALIASAKEAIRKEYPNNELS